MSEGLFLIYHQLKIYNTRYLLHYLQNTLRYYKCNTTRSKISSLPRGFRKGGEEKDAKLHRTMLKKKIQMKGDLKGDLLAARRMAKI